MLMCDNSVIVGSESVQFSVNNIVYTLFCTVILMMYINGSKTIQEVEVAVNASWQRYCSHK